MARRGKTTYPAEGLRQKARWHRTGFALWVAILVAVLVWQATSGHADGNGTHRVLVIDTERSDRPLWAEFTSSFMPSLREQSRDPVDVFYEAIDVARFGAGAHLGRFQGWLDLKYRDRSPEVVVATGPLTFHLMAGWFDRLPAEISVVVGTVREETAVEARRRSRSTALLYEFGHADTIRIALDLLPGTRNIAVVGGAKDSDPHSRLIYDRIAAEFAGRLQIIDLCGLPMDQLKGRVAHLPDHTILVLTSLYSDGDGRPFSQPEMVAELAPLANAPFFGSVMPELGYGILGGKLLDGSIVGRELAGLVARVLNGESADSIAPMWSQADVVAFDWRQLRRWRISPRKLPPGSVVEFRPPSLWDAHRTAVLVALTVFALQGASIVALLRSRERRRRINRQLHRLSGRLISAQEDERRRVARELHDDISQRLALLAIELESACGRTDEHTKTALSRVHSLAEDVHAIAHDLQPPQLEARGLLAELETYCRQIEMRHGVTIDCSLPERLPPVPPDAGLALYRVAQEAVQNAIKHSGADRLEIELAASSRWASIRVADNGRGFQLDRLEQSRGLGLTGMKERVGLLRGWIDLSSTPGEGTTVTAWVPMDQPRAEEAADVPTAHSDR